MFLAWYSLVTLQRGPILPLLREGDTDRIARTVAEDPASYLPGLLAALDNSDSRVREKAAQALRPLDLAAEWPSERRTSRYDPVVTGPERKEMIDGLLKAACDPVMRVRHEAMRSLPVVLRPRAFGIHGESWHDPKQLDLMSALGPAIYPQMLAILRAPESEYPAEVKRTALLVAARFRSIAVLNECLRLIDENDPWFSMLAMGVASDYDDPRIVPALVRNQGRSNSDFGNAAVDVLERMGTRAVADLVRIARDAIKREERYFALDILFRFGGAEAKRALGRAALRDPDPGVRAFATERLPYVPASFQCVEMPGN